MSFEKSFCPSPWFHMRINNSGTYEYCRWQAYSNKESSIVDYTRNITSLSPLQYFNKDMSVIRNKMLNGQVPGGCSDCQLMEQHSKISGRQRQLLKIGVQTQYFESSLASSTYRPAFDYSFANNGLTYTDVVDWQIDLGSYCNSACIFCRPETSTKLATEFKQLGLISTLPPPNWSDDPVLIDKFIKDLLSCKNIKYIHFIGGETLITPAFKEILKAIVDADMASNITVGFTTNITVWDDSIINLLTKFESVHVGLSIEALEPINDYVRYPGKIDVTRELLDRWVDTARKYNWLTQLRITPTCLTINYLTTIYDYAWHKNVSVESCNFIEDPAFMRISVLPEEQRTQAYNIIKEWLDKRTSTATEQIINTRDPGNIRNQLIQDAESYLRYLKSAPSESDRLPQLVNYLKVLEANRGNSILTYLPEYEDLLRSHGY